MAYAKYAWIIDKDVIVDVNSGEEPAVGTMGPSDIDPEFEKQLRLTGEGMKFRLLDDDHIQYYEGRIVGKWEGFEPLDDFGMPNAGCTMISLRNEDGTYSIL